MPEEQFQAAAAGDADEPAEDAGFPMPGAGAPPYGRGLASSSRPVIHDFDDDGELSSSSSDEQDDVSSQGRQRAAAVLKEIRRRNGGKIPPTSGARAGATRKPSLKHFDEDEYEAPEESSLPSHGAGRSSRLVL